MSNETNSNIEPKGMISQYSAFWITCFVLAAVGFIASITYDLKLERVDAAHKMEIKALQSEFNETLRLEKERSRVDRRQALEKQYSELTKTEPYIPKMTLSDGQNSLCLAIMLFGEERMGSELDMVKIAQTVVNRAMDKRWGNNACSVASEVNGGTLQYSSMGPFIGDIKDVVWGRISDFTPYLAKKNVKDMLAWKRIRIIADKLMAGKYPKLTDANHFVALAELKSVPSWVRDIRPVDITSGHVLLIDYEINEDGSVTYYSKDKPYNQARFNLASWLDFDKEHFDGNDLSASK